MVGVGVFFKTPIWDSGETSWKLQTEGLHLRKVSTSRESTMGLSETSFHFFSGEKSLGCSSIYLTISGLYSGCGFGHRG